MVSPIITAILTGLATAGFINLTTTKNANGDTSILSNGQNIITLPESIFSSEIPLLGVKATLERISTSATSRAGTPDVKLLIIAKNQRLFHISIVPDATFKTNGALDIELNGTKLIGIKTAHLTDTDALTIPIPNEGVILNQNTAIEFFSWVSAGTGALTVLVLTGVK